jgi:ABC-type phosphate transport system permease subunit
MSAERSLLPVILPADAGAGRPFRRAAGFLLVAILLPLVASILAQVFNGVDDDTLIGAVALPAIGLAIIAGIHMLAGLMIWLGASHQRRAAQ